MTVVGTRARNANGRILHFKVNPPRVPITCVVCGRVVMRMHSDIRPGQRITTCSPACRDLANALGLWNFTPASTARLDQEPEPAATPADAKLIR
jgi:hypothetical protein